VLALFEEGAHALLLVGGLEAGAEGLLLDHHGLVHREVKPLVDGLLRRAHRDGRVRRDLRGELLRGSVKLRERIDGVDQTDAQGLVRLDVAGGVDHLLRHAWADQTREALGAAEAGGDAETRLGLTEHGGIGADAEITAHGELTAAAERVAADRRDGGNGQGLELAHHVVALLAEALALGLGEAFHLRDVRAGDEGLLPRAAHDQAADGVEVNGVERRVKFGEHLRVERVERLGTVDDEIRDRALRFIGHERHGMPSLFSLNVAIICNSPAFCKRNIISFEIISSLLTFFARIDSFLTM